MLVDGAPVLACQTTLAEVAGRSVTTIEGLASGGRLHPVQQALAEEQACQCGYCTPGMALRAAALLAADDNPGQALIRAAAARFGWAAGRGQEASPGWGIAAGLEKDGRVATCAEVRAGPGGRLRVTRIVTAYECGAVVNPDTVTGQVEGGTIMALGGALFEQVILDHGSLASPSLAGYRVPRFSDVPDIDVVLVDRPDIAPAGAGKTPLIAVAPAVANAIFAATGVRLRSLPLLPAGGLPGTH